MKSISHPYLLLLIFLILSPALCGQSDFEEEATFKLTGSGSYCQGQSGLTITLDGSETGVQYQLLRNGLTLGTPLNGTGGPLTWDNQTEGAYKVVAISGGPGTRIPMDGKVVILEEPEPVIALGYSYYKTLSISAGSVQGGEDLAGFPMYVEITDDPDLRSLTFGGNLHSEEGFDLAFTSQDFAPLPFELSDYDPATGSFRAWVLMPLLSADTNTEILLLFAKEGITGDPSSSGLWDSDFVQVLHLDSDLSDASRYGNYGMGSETLEISGPTGSARAFDGIDDMIQVDQDTTLQELNDQGTFSLWINFTDASDGDHQIVLTTENRFDGDGFEWASQASGNHFFYPSGHHVDDYNMVSNPFSDGIWHYLAVTLNYGSKEVSFFVDGLPVALLIENTPTYWTQLAELDRWLWGGNPDRSTRYFLGAMDEIRLQKEIRPAGWLRTEYVNQSSPESFYTISEKFTLTLFDPVCANESPFSLPDIKPAGGVFSGSGVVGGLFYPAVAGAGTHEITYSYTGSEGCSAQAADTMQVVASPSPEIIGASSLCPGASDELYATDSVAGHNYQWTLVGQGASIASGQGTHRIVVNWGSSSGSVRVTETDPISTCDSTSAPFPVFIGDASGPAFECFENQTIELDTACSFTLPDYTLQINPVDNCDTNVQVEQLPLAGTLLTGSGAQSQVTITARDPSGNETECIFIVSLLDVAPPLAEWLKDTTIVIPEGIYESQVTLTPPQFSDNCGILSIENNFNGGSDASGLYPYGSTKVQYTVTDVNGNESFFTRQVTLEYENAPDYGLIIPEAISPNGDGLNDQFRILGLEAYPANRLEIYNVQGIKVYSQQNYDNSWEGRFLHGSGKGQLLPSGNYYYVLFLEKAGEILKGSLYIRRE